MKHVLLLRFLVLFNVWWISLTLFVHASEEKSYPPSSEPESSESEFTDRGWEQRTTNDEHPPTFHTNTVVGEFPTSEGGQSSDEVTSKKPVNDGKSFTVEAIRRSSVASNEHEHSNLTTERQANSESVSKTNKGKDTVESSSSQSFGQYEVETTDALYSTVDKEKSVTTERSRFSVTLYEEEHSHLTTEQYERQVNSESATKTIEFKDTFESLNTQSVGQHGAETTNTAYSTVDKVKSTTTERSLSSVTAYEEEHSILTTEWQMNRESKFPNEGKIESSSSPSFGRSGAVTTSAAEFLDESNVSSTISKQRDDADVTKSRLETSTEEVLRQTTLTVSEAVTEGVHAKTSDASMALTSPTSLLHSDSNVSSTISKQRDDADVTKTRLGTSTEEVVRQTTPTVSETVTEEVHAKTSDASMAFTSPTSVLHSDSNVSGMISKQRDDADVTKTRLGTSTEEVMKQTTLTVSKAVTEGVHAKTSDASMAFTSPTSVLHYDSNVSGMISKQRDDADVTKTRLGTSTEEVMKQTTLTVSKAVTEGVHAKTSDASMAFTSPTSVLHSKGTTSAMHFPVEDLVAPTNITSVNVTSSSVTLRWCQAGSPSNFSIKVEEVNLDSNTRHRCFGNTSNETIITDLESCNWPWRSYVIPDPLNHDPLKAGATYNSTIRVCNSGRCKDASHIFQTVPADPPIIEDGQIEIGTQSVNLTWVQKGVADNFNVSSVSDPSARVWWAWASDGNKPPMTVRVFIDQLSTPGQLLTISITALSCKLKSRVQTKHINTKPSKPGSLVVFDCQDNNLCMQWNQSGVFDSYVINVNDFEANVSCLNSSDTTNNLRTVNCTVLHFIPFGSNTTLLVAVKSGNQKSDDIKKIYIKVLEQPKKVTIENNSVNSLQVSVEYSCAKCQYMHFLFDIGGKNHTTPCTNQSHKFSSLGSNRRFDIRVYVITNYSGNNLENRISVGSKSVSGWTLPQAVSNLTVTSLTVNSLTLKWNQPDTSDNVNNWYNVSLQSRSEYLQNITLNCNPPVLICIDQQRTYEIKNLTPRTNYTITVWALNEGGFSEKQVITVLTPDLSVSALLVGIIASTVVILILAVFILLFALRKKTKFAVPSARRPSDGLGFQNPTFTSDFGESMKPKPIPLDEFVEHLDELHNDSDLRFSSEYAMLTEMSPKHPQTASEMEENRTKNRYSNILPFDHSRVKLIPLDDDDQGSDYINASYMPGYVSKREFIAAQGPMKSTVDDFWRMIWEQHINTIVMVTNLQERGREKCAEYWPTDEEPVFYGDLQVQMKSESQLNYYIIRILDVKLGEKQRVVKHLHFISWPDFGCPENTAVLLDFVLGVRAHAPSQPLQGSGPILVHCSAGVGRTGTFILVDHLLQRMREHRTLDIFGLVLEMRNYRCNMLQTEAQYVFAHECIKTAIERQMISSIRSSNAEDEDGECLYQNVSKKGEDGECMYQNVSRKDKIEEEEECLYENCTKENMERPPV